MEVGFALMYSSPTDTPEEDDSWYPYDSLVRDVQCVAVKEGTPPPSDIDEPKWVSGWWKRKDGKCSGEKCKGEGTEPEESTEEGLFFYGSSLTRVGPSIAVVGSPRRGRRRK